MKIKKALKEKNKLVAKLATDFAKVHTYNSVEEGSEVPYDPRAALDSAIKTMEELIALKTSIHKANSKVYHWIFRMAELKSLIKQIRAISCDSGKTSDRWNRETPIIKTAVISILERDALITKFELEIEQIQEELDFHNSKTNV